MASLNKTMLIGHLGADPEVRYMPNGEAVADISIATTETWKDKTSGEKKEATEWHRVKFYRKLAEVVGNHLKKGSQIFVEGRLHTQKWTDKNGVDRYTTYIIADEMKMLGKKPESEATPPSKTGGAQPAPESDLDDDIPFVCSVHNVDVQASALRTRLKRYE